MRSCLVSIVLVLFALARAASGQGAPNHADFNGDGGADPGQRLRSTSSRSIA